MPAPPAPPPPPWLKISAGLLAVAALQLWFIRTHPVPPEVARASCCSGTVLDSGVCCPGRSVTGLDGRVQCDVGSSGWRTGVTPYVHAVRWYIFAAAAAVGAVPHRYAAAQMGPGYPGAVAAAAAVAAVPLWVVAVIVVAAGHAVACDGAGSQLELLARYMPATTALVAVVVAVPFVPLVAAALYVYTAACVGGQRGGGPTPGAV
jgi:hypothetical protein